MRDPLSLRQLKQAVSRGGYSSEEVIRVVKHILFLQKAYRERFQVANRSALLLRIIDLAFEKPALAVTDIAKELNVTYPGAAKNVDLLTQACIALDVENTYPRVIIFPEIVHALSVD